MEFLVLTDLHGEQLIVKKILEKALNEKTTALIVCGDITHFGSLIQVKKIIKELAEPGIPLLFVPGNCDPKELANVQSIFNAVNLHNRHTYIEDLSFLGIGGSPHTPFNTPFEISDNEIKNMLSVKLASSEIEKGFILITHTPPINTKVDLTYAGVHAGSQAVREIVETGKPSLVLCGHIHEASGTDIINSTLIINSGPSSKGFWAIIDITNKITYKLSRL